MTRNAVDPVLLETCHQLYLSGKTCREIADLMKGKVSRRSINRYSTQGGWLKERNALVAGKRAHTDVISQAAGQRVELVDSEWREQLRSIVAKLTGQVDRRIDVLDSRKAEIEMADFREVATLLRLQVDALNTIAKMLPAGAGQGDTVTVILPEGVDQE